jgi:hypothetical protein
MRRTILLLLVLALGLATAPVASAQPAWLRPFLPFPETIQLPNGWGPEGITIGPGGTFYSGSIPTGGIYKGNVITGQGSVLFPGGPGRSAVGLKVDVFGRLFVAGGFTGRAWVYDANSGAELRSFTLAPPETSFINDVILTRDAAYFTDSMNPQIYRVATAPWAVATTAETIPLTGDYVHMPGFNVNGIEATPDGRTLILVQSNTGKLFTADPQTGVTNQIELTGGDQNGLVPNGDGLLLDGRTLYVVENFANRIAVVELAPDLSSGTITGYITAPADPAGSNTGFDIPTTVAEFGNRLYLPNARFTTPAGPDTPYWITQVRKR